MANIGFIGIGKMGSWMARHLLNAGHQVTVYDTNQEAAQSLRPFGASVASSVQELGEGNEYVITMLPNSPIVESVVAGPEGLIHTMKPGGLIIDMSSSYVFSTQKLARQCAEAGLVLIDAPVSGGVVGAKNAKLTIMVGADEAVYERALPLLSLMGNKIAHVGETGFGHGLKSINNFLSATSLYATTEAMVLAKRIGIDLNKALDAINTSSGQSFSTHFKFPTFVMPRTFDSGFALDLMLKDIKLVTAVARDTHTPVFIASTIEQIYEAASSLGEDGQDHTEIVKFLEKMINTRLTEQ